MHKKIGKKYQKDEKKDQKRFLEASLVRQADGKLKNNLSRGFQQIQPHDWQI